MGEGFMMYWLWLLIFFSFGLSAKSKLELYKVPKAEPKNVLLPKFEGKLLPNKPDLSFFEISTALGAKIIFEDKYMDPKKSNSFNVLDDNRFDNRQNSQDAIDAHFNRK